MQPEILVQICDSLAKTLQIPPGSVGPHSSMANLEPWDSLQHINVIIDLEEKFNVSFSPDEVIQLNSVESIRDCLNKKLQS
jgi:acyl carrier protein